MISGENVTGEKKFTEQTVGVLRLQSAMEVNGFTNRVTASSLVTLDLEDFYQSGERHLVDIKDQLFQGLILKEKEFREFVRDIDWSKFKDGFVAVHCSSDAIIPTWAFMLIGIALTPYAKKVVYGTLEGLETVLFLDALAKVDWKQFTDAKVVVKGCSKVQVPVAAYVEVSSRLRSVASSIMYGEPCSTVPLYKVKQAKHF